MKTYTAKQLHENPSEVYRAAAKEPVKITHKFHGEFVIKQEQDYCECASCYASRAGLFIKLKCKKGA